MESGLAIKCQSKCRKWNIQSEMQSEMKHNCAVVPLSLPLGLLAFSLKMQTWCCYLVDLSTWQYQSLMLLQWHWGGMWSREEASSPQEHSRDVSPVETTVILLLWDGKDRVAANSHSPQPLRKQKTLERKIEEAKISFKYIGGKVIGTEGNGSPRWFFPVNVTTCKFVWRLSGHIYVSVCRLKKKNV